MLHIRCSAHLPTAHPLLPAYLYVVNPLFFLLDLVYLMRSALAADMGRWSLALVSEQVLAGIFGKKAASNIVSGAGKAKRQGGAVEGAARKKVLAASRKVEVSEVKKYAGKDIV